MNLASFREYVSEIQHITGAKILKVGVSEDNNLYITAYFDDQSAVGVALSAESCETATFDLLIESILRQKETTDERR